MTKTLTTVTSKVWIEFRPKFAQHVRGRFTKREYDPETRMPEPQKYEAKCQVCQQEWQGSCESGAVKAHISKFAAQHTHRDPMASPRIVRPGSLRRSVLEGEEEADG